jgi:hypothetical protein
MPLELQTALISALVALVTVGVGGYFTWSQIQREKNKWLIKLKTSYSVELYKTRLKSYPAMFELLGQLSMHAPDPLTPEKAQQIGQAIHTWLYSPGGLCAETSTRGALKELRNCCSEWKEGPKPPELAERRHSVLFLLRRDLDLHGFESFDPKDSGPLLHKLQSEMSLMK